LTLKNNSPYTLYNKYIHNNYVNEYNKNNKITKPSKFLGRSPVSESTKNLSPNIELNPTDQDIDLISIKDQSLDRQNNSIFDKKDNYVILCNLMFKLGFK